MPNPSLVGVGRDLGRAFRERPALVVGAGVLGLIGISLLGRGRDTGDAAAEGEAVEDPLAGLFPGVGTWGGSIPGSGSVPWAGYPSAGDGSYVDPGYYDDAGYYGGPAPSAPAPTYTPPSYTPAPAPSAPTSSGLTDDQAAAAAAKYPAGSIQAETLLTQPGSYEYLPVTPTSGNAAAWSLDAARAWWDRWFANPVSLAGVNPNLLPGSLVLSPAELARARSLQAAGSALPKVPYDYNPLGLPVDWSIANINASYTNDFATAQPGYSPTPPMPAPAPIAIPKPVVDNSARIQTLQTALATNARNIATIQAIPVAQRTASQSASLATNLATRDAMQRELASLTATRAF